MGRKRRRDEMEGPGNFSESDSNSDQALIAMRLGLGKDNGYFVMLGSLGTGSADNFLSRCNRLVFLAGSQG